jgi:hypothetical protein
MSIGMIMKKDEPSNMNMTDDISGHGFDKMNSMFANNESSSHVLNQINKDVKILANYETSSNLAELLKIVFTNSTKRQFGEFLWFDAHSSRHEN